MYINILIWRWISKSGSLGKINQITLNPQMFQPKYKPNSQNMTHNYIIIFNNFIITMLDFAWTQPTHFDWNQWWKSHGWSQNFFKYKRKLGWSGFGIWKKNHPRKYYSMVYIKNQNKSSSKMKIAFTLCFSSELVLNYAFVWSSLFT